MKTRSIRLPLSIKIVLIGYALSFPIRAMGAMNVLRVAQPSLAWYVLNGIELALTAYEMLALSRLSRWAPVLQAAAMTVFLVNRFLQDPNWTQRYPMLGIFAVITPGLVYFALVLPHWRKMNWAPFGLPYRARAELDVEVF